MLGQKLLVLEKVEQFSADFKVAVCLSMEINGKASYYQFGLEPPIPFPPLGLGFTGETRPHKPIYASLPSQHESLPAPSRRVARQAKGANTIKARKLRKRGKQIARAAQKIAQKRSTNPVVHYASQTEPKLSPRREPLLQF